MILATQSILEHRSAILSTFDSTFKLPKEEVWHNSVSEKSIRLLPIPLLQHF
jgi:hypothetical protein